MTATAFLVHPEATADRAVVHWYVGPELAAMRCGAGTADAPTPLKCLVDAGVLAGAELADDHIATTLGAGRDWRTESAVVRHGVQDALRELADAVDAAPALTRDALLADVARQVLAELVAPVASAHGGGVELVGASDGVVTVRMSGACHGCPAASATLQGRLERGLRARLPWVVGVQVARTPGSAAWTRQ